MVRLCSHEGLRAPPPPAEVFIFGGLVRDFGGGRASSRAGVHTREPARLRRPSRRIYRVARRPCAELAVRATGGSIDSGTVPEQNLKMSQGTGPPAHPDSVAVLARRARRVLGCRAPRAAASGMPSGRGDARHASGYGARWRHHAASNAARSQRPIKPTECFHNAPLGA